MSGGKTSQGWLWGLAQPAGDVVFEWRLFRRHDEAEKLLGDYRGLLQSNGYEAYQAYACARPGVVWLGFWARSRRKFHEALTEAPDRTGFVLRLIGHLHHYESAWRRVGPRRRAALRQSHFALTLSLLHKTARRLQALTLTRSQLGHWAPLTAHLEHGRTRLDTNAVENAIRPSKLSAKNWLFVGHPDAGDRAAVIYSLHICAQRRGHGPYAYLKGVLTRLPAVTN